MNIRMVLARVVSGMAMLFATFPSFAATNIASNVTLAEDVDWRGCGTVTIAQGATVDLNGHTLKVKGINETLPVIWRKITFPHIDGNELFPLCLVLWMGTWYHIRVADQTL